MAEVALEIASGKGSLHHPLYCGQAMAPMQLQHAMLPSMVHADIEHTPSESSRKHLDRQKCISSCCLRNPMQAGRITAGSSHA